MERRKFINITGTSFLALGLGGMTYSCKPSSQILKWKKDSKSSIFHQLVCNDQPLVQPSQLGVLNANVNLIENGRRSIPFVLNRSEHAIQNDLVKIELKHQLQSISGSEEDLLNGLLVIKNRSNKELTLNVNFTTGMQPHSLIEQQKIYIPISATSLNRDKRLGELGTANFHQECEQMIGRKQFACHYFEPMASNPEIRETKALLLAPVVDIQNENSPWRVALFTPSEEPYEFTTLTDDQKNIGWKAGRTIELKPGEEKELNCWLYLHRGEADVAWHAFHTIAHYNEFNSPEWLNDVKVHYYDFLSSAAGYNGLRGDGYEADVPYFKQFKVGMATQHGYYPYTGDFLQPDRKEWLAMQGDKAGAAKMSIVKMKERIAATRKTGAQAAVYMHTVLFDEASSLFESMKESVLIDAHMQPKKFSWNGPDTVTQNWWMSFASKQWTDHLLQQAEYIMDLLDPDAIVFDETFVCLGYDHHPDRQGPLSPYSIQFFKDLRKLVHSYGEDKAILTSDCGGANMVMWADGDAGDHSYDRLLGNPLYRKEPIRYKAAIGDKPWIPCSWHFLKMWDKQMDLARKLGTAVGVSNGWIEFNGLKGLKPEDRERILKDINSL